MSDCGAAMFSACRGMEFTMHAAGFSTTFTEARDSSARAILHHWHVECSNGGSVVTRPPAEVHACHPPYLPFHRRPTTSRPSKWRAWAAARTRET